MSRVCISVAIVTCRNHPKRIASHLENQNKVVVERRSIPLCRSGRCFLARSTVKNKFYFYVCVCVEISVSRPLSCHRRRGKRVRYYIGTSCSSGHFQSCSTARKVSKNGASSTSLESSAIVLHHEN